MTVKVIKYYLNALFLLLSVTKQEVFIKHFCSITSTMVSQGKAPMQLELQSELCFFLQNTIFT